MSDYKLNAIPLNLFLNFIFWSYRLNQNISVLTHRYLVQAFCRLETLCLNIRLLTKWKWPLSTKFNKRRKLCRRVHVRDKFPGFTTERWLLNMKQFSYLVTKQGIQRMQNIASVHPELNLFISRKSGDSHALLLRNVDKICTYPLHFPMDRWQFLYLRKLEQIVVFANILYFYALQR